MKIKLNIKSSKGRVTCENLDFGKMNKKQSQILSLWKTLGFHTRMETNKHKLKITLRKGDLLGKP